MPADTNDLTAPWPRAGTRRTDETPHAPGASRRPLRVALGALLLAAVLGVVMTMYLLRDPLPHFLERRSAIASVSEGVPEVVEGHLVHPVRITATSGLELDLMVKRPAAPAAGDDTARRPVVILLGGHRTGRDAVALIGDTRGAIVAAMSYPFHGESRIKGLMPVLRQVPAIRRAVLDTPPALMLALDYLLARPDADTTQVEGVGVSLGAPFVIAAGALDERFTRIWAVHGSGGSYEPFEHNMRHSVRFAPARIALAALATVILAGPRLAPERWVDRIAPRPFVMVNAEEDERLPRDAILSMYESAGEPKELIWMPGRHVRARREVVRELVDVVLDRIMAPPAPGDASGPPGDRTIGMRAER